MNYIQALIVEINKEYSIVLTADGQFLKQDIPAGAYEIGDSINVSTDNHVENIKDNSGIYRIISRIAIGFTACVVIAAGSYFGVQFLKPGNKAATVAVAESASGKIVQAAQEEKTDDSAPAVEPESGMMLSQEVQTGQDSRQDVDGNSSEGSLTEEPEADEISAEKTVSVPLLYEGNHNLDEANEDFSIDYADIKIDYRIEESDVLNDENELKKSLLFNFLQNKKDHFFNGNIDTVLSDANQSAARTITLFFENFEYGQQRSEVIALEKEEKSFRLVIYGSFN